MITLLNLMPYIDAVVAPSPNQDIRKSPAILGIVLHATQDGGNEQGALAWLRSPKSGVSCHLLVGRAGDVTRLVGDQHRAWHAGNAWWRGTGDVNSVTLGIEIANRNDGEPYTDAQYERIAEIISHYCRQGLTVDDVVSHESIAEERRTDPFGWDWDRMRARVQEALRPSSPESLRWNTYDRRSRERLADEDASITSVEIANPTAHPPETRVIALPTPRLHKVEPPSERRASGSGKSALCSRTLWLNGLAVLAAGSLILGETLDLAVSVGINVPHEMTVWALFGIGMVNIILRFQTRCPIGRGESADRPAGELRPVPVPAGAGKGKAGAGAR